MSWDKLNPVQTLTKETLSARQKCTVACVFLLGSFLLFADGDVSPGGK